jgi:hypothetical protein
VSLVVTGALVYFKIGLRPPLADATGSLARAATLNAEAEAAVARLEAAAAAAAAEAAEKQRALDEAAAAAAAGVEKGAVGGDTGGSDAGPRAPGAGSRLRAPSLSLRARSRALLEVLPGTAASFTAAGALTGAAPPPLGPDWWAAGAGDADDVWRRGDLESASMARLQRPIALQAAAAGADGAHAVVLGCFAAGPADAEAAPPARASSTLRQRSGKPGAAPPPLVHAGSAAAPAEAAVALPPFTAREAALRTMPVWLTVLVLLLTRVGPMQTGVTL